MKAQVRRDLWMIGVVCVAPFAIPAVLVGVWLLASAFGNVIMLGVHWLTGY